MKVLNDKGESVTAFTRSSVYVLSEAKPIDLQQENDILKKRCSLYSSYYACTNCEFKCPYRKKLRFNND